jgi:hypothetical protein
VEVWGELGLRPRQGISGVFHFARQHCPNSMKEQCKALGHETYSERPRSMNVDS